MSKFQIILLSVFGIFILAAVILFSVYRGSGTQSVTVVVWGDIPAYDFNILINNAGLNSNKTLKVQYVEKPKDTFETDFTEALAIGKGPDLVIMPHSKVWKNKNKLLLIPSSTINPKDFSSTFVEEGELLMTPSGTYGLPLFIDPLVLYWNRDLFTKASLTAPPAFWDEIYGYAQKLTERDNAGNLKVSAIAIGEAKNIPNAKEIMSLLMLQAGTPITADLGNGLHSQLSNSFNLPLVPAQAALDFYTQFSNPEKPFYSWNRSLLSAPTSFASGKVGMYVGFASELPLLRAKNPTLNLGISLVPQSRVSGKRVTFGNLEEVSVVKNTTHPAEAFSMALLLASQNTVSALSKINHLPPARRDLLSQIPTDASEAVFYSAAIQSKGWLDPQEDKTRQIFNDMIESVTSGRARIQEAVQNANALMDSLIDQ